MAIFYAQATGHIEINGSMIGVGYSGHESGLNNPDAEAIPDVGPIPRGEWRIARWDDHHGDKGPQVAVLEPVGHDAHGRSGFLIHGDNAALDHTASHGCVIAARTIRDALRASGESRLLVT